MQLSLNLDLPQLGPVLAKLLPLQLGEPQALSISDESFELQVKVKMLGLVSLTAKVSKGDSGLTLSNFTIVGGGVLGSLGSGKIIDKLQQKIAELDTNISLDEIRLRLWGESDGQRLHVEWK